MGSDGALLCRTKSVQGGSKLRCTCGAPTHTQRKSHAFGLGWEPGQESSQPVVPLLITDKLSYFELLLVARYQKEIPRAKEEGEEQNPFLTTKL